MRFLSWVLMVMMLAVSLQAEAGPRLGGGKSIGKQSSNVTQRQAAQQPAAPGAPAAAPSANPAPAAAPAPAAPARRPWGAMLGGLAAGLGLAWLAHSLGMGEAFGNILMVALLALVVMAVIGAVLRARRPASGDASGAGGLAYAGAGAPASAGVPAQYSPDKVGNDASARPWERNSMAFEPAKIGPAGGGVQIGSALAGSQSWGVPAGFDVDGFVSAAKRNFITLQDAWDRSDIPALRAMMTDEMLGEIQAQLSERERHTGGQVNKTDVVMLEAQLLGIEDLADHYMASVEFSGMIREDPSAGASPFREVWNMTKPRDGRSGWLVAGVQALQ